MSEHSEQGRLLKYIDEDAFKLLGDETRRRVVFLLRDSELSAKELSSELGLTVQNIYHHLRRLQEAGLVRVTEERRAGHLIESYYTVTADTFIYNEDRMVERSLQSSVDILNGLNEMDVGRRSRGQRGERREALPAPRQEDGDAGLPLGHQRHVHILRLLGVLHEVRADEPRPPEPDTPVRQPDKHDRGGVRGLPGSNQGAQKLLVVPQK
jgi:DNA-binding transcriptional ArsR family regulator